MRRPLFIETDRCLSLFLRFVTILSAICLFKRFQGISPIKLPIQISFVFFIRISLTGKSCLLGSARWQAIEFLRIQK